MRRIIQTCVMTLGLLMLMTACSGIFLTEKEQQFLDMISVADQNSTIIMELLPQETNKVGLRYVEISIENTSRNFVAFKYDHGVRIHYWDESWMTWIEFENEMNFGSQDDLILWPKGEVFWTDIVNVIPNLTDRPEIQNLRVSALGNIYIEEGLLGEPVLAYIDIILDKGFSPGSTLARFPKIP
jgi:hypothetical protein